MKLTGLQLGFCVSLGLHAAIFGVVALTGLGRHKAHLLPGELERAMTITLVAAPEQAPEEEPPNVAVQAVAPAPVPPAPEPKPLPPPAALPTVVREPEPAPITTVTVPAQPESAPKPPAIPPAPQIAPTAVALKAPSSNPVRGDGSSPRPGDDPTTQQAPLGARAQADYRKNPEPPYPLAARRRRQEGVVLLSVKVSSQGRPLRVDLKRSSGVSVLDEAALQAVRAWEFEPARVGVKPVDSEIEVPVRFKLQP